MRKIELNEEQLNKVSGGDYDLNTLYCLKTVLDAAYTKFNAWVADNGDSTIFEKLAKADEITNEIINGLDADQKQMIEAFKNSEEALWKEMIKEMAGVYDPFR